MHIFFNKRSLKKKAKEQILPELKLQSQMGVVYDALAGFYLVKRL